MVIWSGAVSTRALSKEGAFQRRQIADAAKMGDWESLIVLLRERPELVNSARLSSPLLCAPLHQAAYRDAPSSILHDLIGMGAWRMLPNALGERPVDVAESRGHTRVARILRPELLRCVPMSVLAMIQSHFHSVIRRRVDELVRRYRLRLPELAPLLELPNGEPTHFAVPGMYGGFTYDLQSDGVEAVLVVESSCRVFGGSGQRHEITSQGSRLVDEGFV